MPTIEVVNLLASLLQAAPALLNAITAAGGTGTIPATTVADIFTKYGIDRAVFAAAIAKAEAAGK